MSEVTLNSLPAMPLGRNVAVISTDPNGLVALSKPAGVLSHPNEPGEEPRCLLKARYAFDGEFFEWTSSPESGPKRLWLLNRLDSATSGVILAALNEPLAVEIRAQFKRKQVRKVYHALVFGAPTRPLELWRDMLKIEKRGGQIRTGFGHSGVSAETQMSVIRAGRQEPKVSLLKLEPRTGRSHQLRVQCAQRNLPIVGDQTYGDFMGNREFAKLAGTKRLFLHSVDTSFAYEFGGKRFTFSARAPVPREFEKFL